MSSTIRRCAVTTLLPLLALFVSGEPAEGQLRGKQQQNNQNNQGNRNPLVSALRQQQVALRAALQQTNAVLATMQQNGGQHRHAGRQMQQGAQNQNGMAAVYQQQQAALQTALQQTTTALAAMQQNGQQRQGAARKHGARGGR